LRTSKLRAENVSLEEKNILVELGLDKDTSPPSPKLVEQGT